LGASGWALEMKAYREAMCAFYIALPETPQ
jgi:hypothetical protein